MTEPHRARPVFKPGDRVRHADRPEWGPGVVETVATIDHEGAPAQRLTVRFENHGRVNVHTGYARLIPADAYIPTTRATPTGALPADSTEAWLRDLESRSSGPPLAQLAELPHDCSDLLAGPAQQLRATMELYRFTDTPRSIIEWAIAQTGLTDPLQAFARDQIHQAFDYFKHKRDTHLRDLVRQVRKEGRPDILQQALQHRLPEARNALQRAINSTATPQRPFR